MVVGYKLLSETLTNICGNFFQYEVGKTYETQSCEIHKGFHFCLYPEDCSHFVGKGRLFQIEALGEIESLDGYQYATNKIKIVKEMFPMYTREDWEKDGIFNAKIGQPVAEDVVMEMANSVPPRYFSSYLIQTGDPYSHEYDSMRVLRPTYTTFKFENNNWIYCGNCFFKEVIQ